VLYALGITLSLSHHSGLAGWCWCYSIPGLQWSTKEEFQFKWIRLIVKIFCTFRAHFNQNPKMFHKYKSRFLVYRLVINTSAAWMQRWFAKVVQISSRSRNRIFTLTPFSSHSSGHIYTVFWRSQNPLPGLWESIELCQQGTEAKLPYTSFWAWVLPLTDGCKRVSSRHGRESLPVRLLWADTYPELVN